MLQRVAILITFLTIPSLAFADADPWGNEYPAECADLSGIKVQVIDVGHLPVQPDTASRCGVWLQRPGGTVIYLLKTCDKPRAEVLRHELTHECMNRLHGDPRWHD